MSQSTKATSEITSRRPLGSFYFYQNFRERKKRSLGREKKLVFQVSFEYKTDLVPWWIGIAKCNYLSNRSLYLSNEVHLLVLTHAVVCASRLKKGGHYLEK